MRSIIFGCAMALVATTVYGQEPTSKAPENKTAAAATRPAASLLPKASPTIDPKLRGPIVLDDSFWNRAKTPPSPVSTLGDAIDFSDKPVRNFNTKTVRVVAGSSPWQPFTSVSQQKTDLDETLRYGVGGGVRYRISPSFNAVLEILSYGTTNHANTNAPEEGENILMLSLEWRY